LFGKQKEQQVVVVEIAEETRATLKQLDNDVQALIGLVDELVASQATVMHALRGELRLAVEQATGSGVVAFAEEEQKDNGPGEIEEDALEKVRPPSPYEISQSYDNTTADDPSRIRNSPFTRTPRSTQVTWLTQVMADGGWYNALGIAREYANDERHFRYLRHAIGGRLREMHEDSILERRDSRTTGAMFEYRLWRKEQEQS